MLKELTPREQELLDALARAWKAYDEAVEGLARAQKALEDFNAPAPRTGEGG